MLIKGGYLFPPFFIEIWLVYNFFLFNIKKFVFNT